MRSKSRTKPATTTLASPLGFVGLEFLNDKLVKVSFASHGKQQYIHPEYQSQVKEIIRYFKNPAHQPKIDMAISGTAFQQSVWKALLRIPAGETITYGELAKKLKTSPRAIGQACRTNPLPLVIPCHRVVAANHLGGFAGQRSGRMMAIKKQLLKHELSLRGARSATKQSHSC